MFGGNNFFHNLFKCFPSRFGAENTLAIPAVWILWLVALDFFRSVNISNTFFIIAVHHASRGEFLSGLIFCRWNDRSKQRKVLRSLTKDKEESSNEGILKSITVEDTLAQKKDNWSNVVRRNKPRKRAANVSNRPEPKLSIEGPPTEKEDEDAFSVREFFKDMCTIWNCLATQSKKENKKAMEIKSEDTQKDPSPLPAIEHKTDEIEANSKQDDKEKEGEVEICESECGSETSSSGGEFVKDIVDYQSMIYLPENQLKQIGKALAAVHCWYCKGEAFFGSWIKR